MLHRLEKAPGSTKNRKRVGRGPGSTLGKTCGKGHKGAKSRSGASIPVGFEGGQMPLHRRLPKRGFTNIFRQEYHVVNLQDLVESKKLDLTVEINAEALAKAGIIRSTKLPLKVLGVGELSQSLTVVADKFSASAEKKIQDAGGTATVAQ